MRQRGQVRGWDGRDYELWSALQQLPSYGLIPQHNGGITVSLNEVIRTIEMQAERRFDLERGTKGGGDGEV